MSVTDELIMPVLDHGQVQLKRWMADDLYVVEAAKASFKQEVFEFGDTERGILRFMMKNSHGSPFEHEVFTFVIKAPIFVAREWFRHRMSSFNEQSGRYSKLDGDFYLPELEDMRTQIGKPGAYTFESMNPEHALFFQNEIKYAYDNAWATYEDMLDGGVAKEIARLVLPVGTYTSWYWTINARSLMNFLRLRNAPDAQREIRKYAEVVENYFAMVMPETHAAFVEFGRIVP